MRKKKNTYNYTKFFPILLVVLTLFMMIGYASVNSITLDILGTAKIKEQTGVFITDVYYDSDNNADIAQSQIINSYQTMLNTKVVLSDTDPDSSITYSITVYNSTNEVYYFDKVDYLTDDTTYSNNDIAFRLNGLNTGDSLEGKGSLTFSITFYYKDNILASDNELHSYLNFLFKRNFSISYTNIQASDLPTTIFEGEDLILNLLNIAPSNVEVYVDGNLITDYTYTNYLLTISSVTGNIRIVGVIGAPNLQLSNLVPVSYDNSTWRVADTSFEWYDYGTQEWANAVVLKSGVTLNTGDEVDVANDVRAMFVWIPRYEYKIATDGSNEIFINFISKEQTTSSSGYILHPAFTFGTTELNGIWVGKFETSTEQSNSCYTSPSPDNCNNTSLGVYILPNVKSLREQTISIQFNLARNFSQYLTGNSINSHMLKNSEWGAVAYLSQSQYGKFGNKNYSSSNREIYVNNSSELYTGRSSGSSSFVSSEEKSYEYDYGFNDGVLLSEENGVGASTTGNITGIYDMNGGTYEYVMGYLSIASSTFGSTSYYDYAGFTTTPESKYYDDYVSETVSSACNGQGCYGHALEETAGWYNDNYAFLTVDNPWFMRGGVFDSNQYGGIFTSNATIGYSGAYATFRIALVEE